jgi:hypothetical protein
MTVPGCPSLLLSASRHHRCLRFSARAVLSQSATQPIAIAKRIVAADNAWRGSQYKPMRLSTPRRSETQRTSSTSLLVSYSKLPCALPQLGPSIHVTQDRRQRDRDARAPFHGLAPCRAFSTADEPSPMVEDRPASIQDTNGNSARNSEHPATLPRHLVH